METKKKYVKSPLNYVGGKTKLLPQILPIFPYEVNHFVDLFAGGGNVAVNVVANKITANDINDKVIGIYKYLQEHSTEEVLQYIEDRIAEYNLNKVNRDGFNDFREMYNQSTEKNPLDLFVLIAHAFNHQIRFNSKGEYNMPFGKDRSEYNKTMKQNLIDFKNSIENITFTTDDFRKLDLDKLSPGDLIYADPPYLITCAAYNESGGWGIEDELDLYVLLNKANQRNIKFAMSNVLFNKGKVNDILLEWAENNYYTIHHLNASYSNCNYHAKDKESKADEVLITNF